ncbi:hypothetical protein Droror1_Dr00004073 [Drosera rotundifolia]
MAPAKRVADFRREGDHWFYDVVLPSDVTVVVGGQHFHLHKFPLVSRCGKLARELEENTQKIGAASNVLLDGFPGGSENFLVAVKHCYGFRVELTPRNLVMIYCAADYLEMTDEYGDDNLLSKCHDYLHKKVLRNWKDCILTLQSSESAIPYAEKLQIISKCMNAMSVMACTDPSLFGWPMRMYGSLQSPGGSILWNGINTGAKIRRIGPEWWYEDISYLGIDIFLKLIKTMQSRGIRPEHIAGMIMYYARKYLPGLRRWKGMQDSARTVTSLSTMPKSVDQRVLVEVIVDLLPEKKSKSYCRFLSWLLRVALILGVSQECRETIERRIGVQMELATLDCLLIPTYSDSDTLYDTDCFQRILQHFLSSDRTISPFSPSSVDEEMTPSSAPLRRVARLVDNYIAEVASDVNLKPNKIQALLEAMPEGSRSLHDGLYRALDIYYKAHPWLSDSEKENVCNIIDYQKLSIDACAHATQNERLPLRVVLQVLFFEQLRLRTTVASCLQAVETQAELANPVAVGPHPTRQTTRRDRWVTTVRENHDLKVDFESMRTRVRELEEELRKIRLDMGRVSKPNVPLAPSLVIPGRTGCGLLPRASEVHGKVLQSAPSTPRSLVENVRDPQHSRHRKSSSYV